MTSRLFDAPLGDLSGELGGLVAREELREFNHAALVEFPIEGGLRVPSLAERWALGCRVALLVLGDGPLRREREDA